MESCIVPPQGRRRLFWATQPQPCGVEIECGFECGDAGLSFDVPASGGVTISTTDWIRGLILNILLTDGKRPDTPCGYRPGAQGGHWSESFMTVEPEVGTLLRTIEAQSRVNDTVRLLEQYTEISLQRLVTRGVANSIEVEARYDGGNVFILDISVIGKDGQLSNVGLSGTRSANSWLWENM